LSAGKPAADVPPNTDAVPAGVAEDVPMPSIWILLAVAVGAINLNLMIPGILAFVGVGKWSVRHQSSARLTS
jgi:hypothetical protein